MKPFIFIQTVLAGTFSIGFSATEIEKEISEIEAQITSVTEAIAENISKFSKIEEGKELIEALRAEFPEMEANIEAKERLGNIYRSAYRFVSPIAEGTALGDLLLKDGSSIKGAVFVSPEIDGLSVTSPSGPKRIGIDVLPEDLKARFAFPNPPDTSGVSYAEAMNKKPDAAKSSDEIESEMAASSEVEATPGNTDATVLSASAIADVEKTEAAKVIVAEKSERNSARQKQIDSLRTRYSATSDQRKKVINERTQKATEFRSSSIKTAKATVDRAMEQFNSKISQLEDEQSRIQSEIARIQSEWE